MRVRKKPRHEVAIEKKGSFPQSAISKNDIIKTSEHRSYTKKLDSVANVTNNDIQSMQLKYEREVKKLKQLLEKSTKLTKNEEKIICAIRSEKIFQNTSAPIISRNLFMKKYNIRPKYLDKSIQGLLCKDLAKRTFIKYSVTQKTSKWELL